MLLPNGTQLPPMDVNAMPFPARVVDSHSWRMAANEDRSLWTLRITAAIAMPGGQVVPTVQQHEDTVFTEEHLILLIEKIAMQMTPAQKVLARAALSDVDVPAKPSIELP